MLIESYLLEQFEAVARCGTLLKASEELHISQPSLSRSMKKLEDVLGVSLFIRENSKITLNETGKLAADYARRALEANQEMINRVTAFDRSLRTVSIGSCSPFPVNNLMPILQEQLPEKTLSTELVGSDEKLLAGLRSHLYQMVVLHHLPEEKDLFCQRYLDEQLYVSVAEDHPLAEQDSVTFEELKGLRILMTAHVGFWMDVTLEKLNASDLLIQNSMDALGELIDASNLPFFNSDQMLKAGYQPPDRVALPITDPEAHATYWIACLTSEQQKYRSVFSTVRGNILRRQS
jgi:DNA-binding transcriptional LysR family regulator